MRFNQQAEKETSITSFWCNTEHVCWNATCCALASFFITGERIPFCLHKPKVFWSTSTELKK